MNKIDTNFVAIGAAWLVLAALFAIIIFQARAAA